MFVHENFHFITDCLQFGGKYIESEKTNIDVKFWKDIFLSFNVLLEKVEPSSWKELASIPLWYNQSIKIGDNVVFYRNWKNKGIVSINDLLDSNGDLLTFEFQRKFHLQSNFLVFEGLVRSMKDYIFSFIFAPFLH